MTSVSLLQEFPPVSTQAWEEAIARDLKGADYSKRLLWQSGEGLAVKPYYRAEDLRGLEHLDLQNGHPQSPPASIANGGWRIREEIDADTLEEANRAACLAVAAGAEEIAFSSVVIEHDSGLGLLLADLRRIPIHFESPDEPLLRLLAKHLSSRPSSSRISAAFDPLRNPGFAAELMRSAPAAFAPFTIHADQFEESGATAVEEIGIALAAAVDFLAEMQSRGVNIDRAADSITFSFAIGANFFFQMAKFRSFRILWPQIVESFGGTPATARAFVHARTSRWNKTVYDPHVNILRGTTEAISAALGGVDSITVAPFDECYKRPDDASRRLARNTQILLKQEALFSRVADPGAGSYCLEVMTGFLAREGWKCMQAIEAAGGYRKTQRDGTIGRMLHQSMAAREESVSSRRRTFTGASNFANPAERAVDRIDPSRMARNPRATAGLEQVRLRTEQHEQTFGASPSILLAEFGDVRMRSARSSFAANFLACAGYDAATRHFDNAAEIAAGAAHLIVLCSSDAEYLPLATELMPILEARGRHPYVLVAGNPDSAPLLKAAGVDDFIHVRTDLINFFTQWQQRLGIGDQ